MGQERDVDLFGSGTGLSIALIICSGGSAILISPCMIFC